MRSKAKSAREYFRIAFKGYVNFLTPEAIEFGWVSPHLAFELSEGAGFGGNITGVTILDVSAMRESAEAIKRDSDLSRCFNDGTRVDNHRSARAYIAALRERFGGDSDG